MRRPAVCCGWQLVRTIAAASGWCLLCSVSLDLHPAEQVELAQPEYQLPCLLYLGNARSHAVHFCLQVELAQSEYQLPRLTRMWTHLERQSGSGQVG